MTIKETFRWTDKNFAVIMCFAVSIFFFAHQINRPALENDNDIITIEGNIINYSFRNTTGYKNSKTIYYLWLNQYQCTFQIKADYINYFYQSDFERYYLPEKKVKIAIPKEYATDLDKRDKKVFILSLEDKSQVYLNKDKTIEKEKGYFDTKAGIFFIIFGIVIYFFNNRIRSNYH